MREHAPGLFECLADTAMVVVVPGEEEDRAKTAGPEMVEIVLRPLRRRPPDNRQANTAFGEAA
jgi:hypothetical protein